MEAFRSGFQVHGALEGEHGSVARVAVAEVCNGWRAERAACAVREDQRRAVCCMLGPRSAVVACDGLLHEIGVDRDRSGRIHVRGRFVFVRLAISLRACSNA